MRKKKSFWLSSQGVVALCAIAIVAYFLLIEHRQHLAEWFPYLILLLCPLMHIFMHSGHHHKDNSDDSDQDVYQKGIEEGKRQQSMLQQNKEQHDDAQ